MVLVNLQMFKHTTKPKLFWKLNNQVLRNKKFTKKGTITNRANEERQYEEPRPNAANDLGTASNEHKSY